MAYPSRKKVVGTSHSKLILIGEHAVVYGKPAIALPFPLIKVTSTIEEAPEKMITFESAKYTGSLSGIPKKMEGLKACIEATLKLLKMEQYGFHMKLESEIPIGRGLGSSAAVAIAIVRSLFLYFNEKLDRATLMNLVEVAEKFAHGNPSGIDMAAASSSEPILFIKNKHIEIIKIKNPFYIVVADSGRIGDTLSAVDSIRKKFECELNETKVSIDLLGDYAHKVKECLNYGKIDELGKLLTLAQLELDKLGVSDDGLNHLVETALKAGAYGAKLTGGGRGGCIIALAKKKDEADEIAKQLLEAGANQTWIYLVSSSRE